MRSILSRQIHRFDILLACFALGACNAGGPLVGSDDGGFDAGPLAADAGSDAGAVANPDAAIDAGLDGGRLTEGSDAGPDAGGGSGGGTGGGTGGGSGGSAGGVDAGSPPSACSQLPAGTTFSFDAQIAVTSLSSTLFPGQAISVHALNSGFSGTDDAMHSHIGWDFGDPNGTYNCLVGFNAAHVYDTPGSYTVTLTITTPSGEVGQATAPVKVQPENRKTVYVAQAGSDGNPGTSPTSPLQTLEAVQSLLSSSPNGLIVLFNRGDTFQFSSASASLNLTQSTNVELGAYGTAASAPLLTSSASSAAVGWGVNAQNITVQDLAIQGTGSYEINFPGTGIVIRRNDVSSTTSLNDAIFLSGSTNVLVQDNQTNVSGYGIYLEGPPEDVVLLGNRLSASGGQHDIRGGSTRLLIAENWVSQSSNLGAIEIQGGDYTYVVDNYVEGSEAEAADAGGPTQLQFGQIGNGSATVTCLHLVAEGNVLKGCNFKIDSSAQPVVLRNNLVQNALQNPGPAFQVIIDNDHFTTLDGLEIVNNTAIDDSPDGWGNFMGLDLGSGTLSGGIVDRNLYLAPHVSNTQGACFAVGSDCGSGCTLSGVSEFSDNVWYVPALAADQQFALWGKGLTAAQFEATSLTSGVYPQGDTFLTASPGLVPTPLTQWTAGDYALVLDGGLTIGATLQ